VIALGVQRIHRHHRAAKVLVVDVGQQRGERRDLVGLRRDLPGRSGQPAVVTHRGDHVDLRAVRAPRDGPGPGRRPSGPTARSPRPSRGPPRSSRTPRGPAAWPARSAVPAGHADRAPIPAAPATPDHQTDRSPPEGSHRPDMPRAGQRTGTAKMDRRARHSDDHELRELHDLPAPCSFVTPGPPVTTASNPVKHGTLRGLPLHGLRAAILFHPRNACLYRRATISSSIRAVIEVRWWEPPSTWAVTVTTASLSGEIMQSWP
jgi:hypothetical protein